MNEQPSIMFYTKGDYWTDYIDKCSKAQTDFNYRIDGFRMCFKYNEPHKSHLNKVRKLSRGMLIEPVIPLADPAPFGRSIVIILPPHGEINCPCRQCTLYRLVTKLNKMHYELSSLEDL